MTIMTLLILTLLALLGVFVFTGVEAATLAVNRPALSGRLREQGKDADQTFRLIANTQRALGVALVGINACALVGALALDSALRRLAPPWFPGASLILSVIILTPLYLLASEGVARYAARRHATGFLLWTRGLLRVSEALLTPLLAGCARVAGWVLRPFGVERALTKRPMTVEEILDALGEGDQAAPTADVSERDMIHSALDLEESNVREVMRPLVDVVAIKYPEMGVAAALETARQTDYSRFPVFRRRIIEMTEYIDITRLLADGAREGALDAFLRPALIVPETMRIDVLLRTLTETREPCAIVVDEFGGVVGWVTRTDVLEEIVGDIADKDADEEPGWERGADGVFHVETRIDLDDLNDAIGARLGKGDDFDTLGGWLYNWIGRIPRVGEQVEAEGARVTVEAMDGHRLRRAAIELIEEDAEDRD